MPADTTDGLNEAIVATWRAESARLVGALTRMTRDLDLAEDLAQDALVAALEQWASGGVPENPGAWLMAVAKRRGIDHFRRADTLRRKTAELEHALGGEEAAVPDLDDQVDSIEDDVLRLIFLSCHPALTPESRAALTLRLVGGLTTAEIARGFMVSDSSMGQRISRAKRTLVTAGVELELPTGSERTARLDDVMAVIYLIFNEGYSATSGADWMRPELAHEGMRLARMLTALAPGEVEVLGLQALVEIQGSRLGARVDEDGAPVLLEAQDRGRWDGLLIRRGLGALAQAEALAARGVPVGKYFLQASIAAEHARAARAEDTNWRRIAVLYDVLASAAPGLSSRSTERWRTGGRSARTLGWPCWLQRISGPWATRRCCPACEVTCSSGRVGTPRLPRHSPRPPRSPTTRASAASSDAARRRTERWTRRRRLELVAERWVSTKQGAHLAGRRKVNTAPEVLLRRAVHAAGGRFRLHRQLARACTPDFVLPGRGVAVFVDGCFWHGCPVHGRKTPWTGPNAELWAEKMRRNAERDRRATELAEQSGWRVVRVWECEVRDDPDGVAHRVMIPAVRAG